MNILEVKNINFKYKGFSEYILKNISFEVKKGQFYFIIGKNGSGKTSLCRCLTGLIPNYFKGDVTGEVSINQKPLLTIGAELPKNIGYVFQNPIHQLTHVTETVEQELAFGLENFGVPKNEMNLKVKAISSFLDLDNLLKRNPLNLSGGQIQRVALASVLILEPKILVLDEPLSQLDPKSAEKILKILKMLKDKGITIIMAENDLEVVVKYADKLICLNNGEILCKGTIEDVFIKNQDALRVIGQPMLFDIVDNINKYRNVKIIKYLDEKRLYEELEKGLDTWK